MATKRQRKAVPGNEGHRDEDIRQEQREEAYRLHTFEGWSMRQIAAKQGVSHATTQLDIATYQRMLREELPKTFETWQMRLYQEYARLLEEADQIMAEERSGFVRVQALKIKVELQTKIEQLFGVNKAVKAPVPDEAQADDEIRWEV